MSTASPMRVIPTVLIDPPLLAMRVSFDDEKFEELKDSIRAHGLLQPVVVFREESRYRVVAGHRRLEACKAIGVAEIECKVVEGSDAVLESMKIDENYRRENVNPADEAEYLHTLYESLCKSDVNELCRVTGLSFSYVSDRLNLLTGDARIRDAVKAEKIGIGVANELNRIKSDASRFAALDTATRYGCTVRQARELRTSYNLQFDRDEAARNGAPLPDPVPTSSESIGSLCVICEDKKDPHELQIVHMHSYCMKAIFQQYLNTLHGRN